MLLMLDLSPLYDMGMVGKTATWTCVSRWSWPAKFEAMNAISIWDHNGLTHPFDAVHWFLVYTCFYMIDNCAQHANNARNAIPTQSLSPKHQCLRFNALERLSVIVRSSGRPHSALPLVEASAATRAPLGSVGRISLFGSALEGRWPKYRIVPRPDRSNRDLIGRSDMWCFRMWGSKLLYSRPLTHISFRCEVPTPSIVEGRSTTIVEPHILKHHIPELPT